jgi:hypothetical protein
VLPKRGALPVIPCKKCERLQHKWATVIEEAARFQRERRQREPAEIDDEHAALLEMAQWDIVTALEEHCAVHRPAKLAGRAAWPSKQ